jgi:spore germination protein GerM
MYNVLKDVNSQHFRVSNISRFDDASEANKINKVLRNLLEGPDKLIGKVLEKFTETNESATFG